MKWLFKRGLDRLFGEKVDFYFWKYRHFLSSNWMVGYLDEKSVNSRHRPKLISLILGLIPERSRVLEVGSGSGQNLILLKKTAPHVVCEGLEINAQAVKHSVEKIREERLDILIHHWDSIVGLGMREYDIVFTDAVLLYISPKNLFPFVNSMIDRSSRGVVLFEQFTEREPFYNDKWVHSIKQLELIYGETLEVHEVLDIWRGEDWKNYGKIVFIKKAAV